MNNIEHAKELPQDAAAALLQWGVALADTKFKLGMKFSGWVTGTPALEAAVGSAAMTQDELGHARSLWAVLRELPGAPDGLDSSEDLGARTNYFAPKSLDADWSSWLDVVASVVVLDHALHLAAQSAEGSAFAPLAALAGKISQEERFHRAYGEAWLTRLMRDETIAPKLRAALTRSQHTAEEWLGQNGDAATTTLKAAGILNTNTAELRTQWLAAMKPIHALEDLPAPQPPREIHCAFCNSNNIKLFSHFGQTLLGSQYYCNGCKSVFEVIRF